MKKRIESVLSQSDAVAEKWLHLHAYTLFVMVAAACVLELAGGYLLNAIEGFVNSSLQRYLIKYIAIPITTFGLAACRPGTDTLQLVRQADSALYSAKVRRSDIYLFQN